MIVTYSQAINSPIVEIRGQTTLGRASDLVIQKSDFSIKAILIKGSIFNGKKLVVNNTDILEIVKNAIIVNDDDASQPLEESPRVQQAIDTKAFGVSFNVVTKSGKKIGRVYDYTFDSQGLMIINIYVKSLLNERIIPRTAIIKFDKGTITIEDDYELMKAKAMPETAKA